MSGLEFIELCLFSFFGYIYGKIRKLILPEYFITSGIQLECKRVRKGEEDRLASMNRSVQNNRERFTTGVFKPRFIYCN